MKKLDWTVLSIVFVGGLARFWGINFGLPHTECRPDESIITGIAFGFFSGDFNPHFFSYPTLYIYVLHGLYFLYYSIGKLFLYSIFLKVTKKKTPSTIFLRG